MKVLAYLLLFLGLIGVIHGVIDFFVIGTNFDSYKRLYDVEYAAVYEAIVRRTADYLILFGGSLLFLWLL